jgi:hypothetical protein
VELNYLFGRPVLPARPSTNGPREVLILGAYPSALHIRWVVPGLARLIQAVAVDNEPEPFWTGADERARIERWQRDVSFHDSWGQVSLCGRFNGSSGQWLEEQVLQPLGPTRARAWITDCLDIYFESAQAREHAFTCVAASLFHSPPPRRGPAPFLPQTARRS